MAQTTEMKKRKFTKVFALLLAMVMVLALPVEASAAAKVTAVTKETKAKAVKKGKTVVTLPKATKKSSTYSYVKFKAPATKTYKITKRKVKLTSASDQKVYDGQPLTNKNVTASTGKNEGFVNGEGATYDVTGSQTTVGSSANKFTYTLNANTKAANY